MGERGHGSDSTITTDINDEIDLNTFKLTADKIQQELAVARNNASRANRRWIWELMQNAKDTPNRFGRVKVEIQLQDDALTFRHNGDPFATKNLAALIQQVSSKPPNSSDPDIIGKFGTGFVATHLLADIVYLTGLVHRPDGVQRRFHLRLDRSALTSEALQASIRDALAWLRHIDENAEAVPNYDAQRSEDDLDTEFHYPFKTAENSAAARMGVDDLIHTLPATLVNLPAIVEVRIRSATGAQTYRCTRDRFDDRVARYTVTIEDDAAPTRTVRFLAYEISELRLLATIEGPADRVLVPLRDVQPRLHRGFPLIGSEKFHFPFILAGHRFFPTDQRDGLLLNGATPEANLNHEILDAAIDAAIAFTDWLTTHDATDLYVLADTRLPHGELEESTVEIFQERQQRWRSALLDRALVETDAGPVKLRDARIPHSADPELRRLVAALHGRHTVPQESLLARWITALGPNDEAWGHTLFVDAANLAEDVKNIGSLGALTPADGATGLAWLNHFYAFLAARNLENLCDTRAIVPNQQGSFQQLPGLYRERSDDQIPGPILDVLGQLSVDWRAELLDREVALELPVSRQRGLHEASQLLNQRLSQEHKDPTWKEQRWNACLGVLRLTAPNAKDDSYRRSLYRFACELFGRKDETLAVENLKNLQFATITRLVTIRMNRAIASYKTLATLAEKWRHTELRVREWLAEYLALVNGSDEHRLYLKDYAVVPNRLGVLCTKADLQAFGTRDQPLDDTLVEILRQIEPKQDLRAKLAADGFNLDLPPYTFETLGSVLLRAVDALHNKEEQHRVPLLQLIEWCKHNPDLCDHYLKPFKETSKTILFKLMLAGSGSGEQLLQIMQKPETIPHLAELATLQPDELTAAMAHAHQIREENTSFRFMQQIGAKMEDLFEQALAEAGIPATVKFRGIGAWDFELTNPANGRQIFIEFKSYKRASDPPPIRLALSQAKQAGLGDKPYAICVVSRVGDPDNMTTDDIRADLRYLKDLAPAFAEVRDEILFIEARSSGDIHLDIPGFHDAKVQLSHQFIDQHGLTFAELIADIHAALK